MPIPVATPSTMILPTFLLLLCCTSCGNAHTTNEAHSAEGQPPTVSLDHRPWDKLLQAHVGTDGLVDYATFAKDQKFATYLKQLSDAKPSSAWSADERKAFWINTYNAFTIKLILDNPGVKSIKDIASPWEKKFFSIGGMPMDLETIEHTELRKNLKDPRIHFAIVCASFSCPQLWNRAYTAAAIDKQLDDAARRFINDPVRNKITGTKVELSKIFDWFKGDFTKKGTMVDYINKYAAVPLAENASIGFLDYDWKLNSTR